MLIAQKPVSNGSWSRRLLPRLSYPIPLCSLSAMYEDFPMRDKKRKVDMGALQSEFKRRVPSLDLAAARDLLDLGFAHVDELRGRSPEALLDSVRKLRPDTPPDRLSQYRMMVYYAETPDPELRLLQAHMWS